METVDWDGLMAKVQPMLPKGAVVVSAETVAEIKRLRDQAFKDRPSYYAFLDVLFLLGVKEEKG